MPNLELIKQLREITFAPMNECKVALQEANDDLEKAIDIIKVRGLNIATSRSTKIATEGVIGIGNTKHFSVIVECNSQTDFTSRSPAFTNFVQKVVDGIIKSQVGGNAFDTNSVEEDRQALVSSTKENIVIRRWLFEKANANTNVFSYMHPNKQIGVLLSLSATNSETLTSPEFQALGNDLTMQVAAMKPIAVSSDKIEPTDLDRQKAIFEEQLAADKKPEAMRAKIVEGKLRKWYSEVCLVEQESIITPKALVKQIVKDLSIKLGTEITVESFVRFEVGEGLVQAPITNLADEVAKLTAQ